MFRYTDERNAQIVVALLKAKGIHYVVASPGTTNGPIIGSVQNDSFFEVFSCIDERSAAYMACGIAESTGEVVVLSCTGATASRNYIPGLTEAYYRKLPILAITSMGRTQEIGNLRTQIIDRSVMPNDIAVESVNIEPVVSTEDVRFAELQANRAMEALFRNGGGPAHIQLVTLHNGNLGTSSLPAVHNMQIVTTAKNGGWPEFPKNKKILIFIGACSSFTSEETETLERFAVTHDAVILTSIVSGYRGEYAFNASLVGPQLKDNPIVNELKPELIIHIGEMSGNYDGLLSLNDVECDVWRISLDGVLRQSFGHLRYVFQASPQEFFSRYSKNEKDVSSCGSKYRDSWKTYISRLERSIPQIPFSNIWIANFLSSRLTSEYIFHPSIMSSLSAANFFPPSRGTETSANVGGFGIDGCVSSLVGASLVNPDKLCVSLVGDLAFFYDMNCLGNRHIGSNLRIILVNNNRGMTFKHSDHFGSEWGDKANPYLAAAGHFLSKGRNGNTDISPAQAWVESLGFSYLRATSQDTFNDVIDTFLSKNSEFPMLLECFTTENNEREARDLLFNLDKRKTTKGVIKKVIKTVFPSGLITLVKKVMSE